MQLAVANRTNAVDFRSIEIYDKLKDAKSQDLFSHFLK